MRMKITDYFDQEGRSLDSTARKIRDFRVLDFNFIPAEPLERLHFSSSAINMNMVRS
jgi:hypothetical protein